VPEDLPPNSGDFAPPKENHPRSWLWPHNRIPYVLITVSEQVRVNPARYSSLAGEDPAVRQLFGWWTDPCGEVGGAFLHTPPLPSTSGLATVP
jgi:hypothetical protein